MLRARSPLINGSRCTRALHRTPISESEQFYQALKLRGIDTALVRVPGSSHGIAGRPSRLIGKVEHILAWFEKYKTDASEVED